MTYTDLMAMTPLEREYVFGFINEDLEREKKMYEDAQAQNKR